MYCLKMFLCSFIQSLSIVLIQQLVTFVLNTHFITQNHRVHEFTVPGSTSNLDALSAKKTITSPDWTGGKVYYQFGNV